MAPSISVEALFELLENNYNISCGCYTSQCIACSHTKARLAIGTNPCGYDGYVFYNAAGDDNSHAISLMYSTCDDDMHTNDDIGDTIIRCIVSLDLNYVWTNDQTNVILLTL